MCAPWSVACTGSGGSAATAACAGAGGSSAVAVSAVHLCAEPRPFLLALATNRVLTPLSSTIWVYRIPGVITGGFISVQFSVAEGKQKTKSLKK